MEKRRKVVLYGGSLLLLGIEASLRECPTLDVIRLESQREKTWECLNALEPDVITYDSTFGEFEFAIPLIEKHPDLMIVGLNSSSDKTLVLTGKQYTIYTTSDLLQVIDGKRDVRMLGSDSDGRTSKSNSEERMSESNSDGRTPESNSDVRPAA